MAQTKGSGGAFEPNRRTPRRGGSAAASRAQAAWNERYLPPERKKERPSTNAFTAHATTRTTAPRAAKAGAGRGFGGGGGSFGSGGQSKPLASWNAEPAKNQNAAPKGRQATDYRPPAIPAGFDNLYDTSKDKAASYDKMVNRGADPNDANTFLEASGRFNAAGAPGSEKAASKSVVDKNADAKERLRIREKQVSAVQKGVEVSQADFDKMDPQTQRKLEFNRQLLDAIKADKESGNSQAVREIRNALKLTDKDVTLEEMSAGVPLLRTSELNQPSQAEKSQVPGTGIPKGTTVSDRGNLIEKIGRQIEDYFRQENPTAGGASVEDVLNGTGTNTPEKKPSVLDKVAGAEKTEPVKFTVPENEPMAVAYENVVRPETWETSTLADLKVYLDSYGIDQQEFNTYAAERAKEQTRQGVSLSYQDPSLKSLSYDDVLSVLNLTEK